MAEQELCVAIRDGKRCTSKPTVTALRLTSGDVEVLLPLRLCPDCQAVVQQVVCNLVAR